MALVAILFYFNWVGFTIFNTSRVNSYDLLPYDCRNGCKFAGNSNLKAYT
jgi:hypothetical protein